GRLLPLWVLLSSLLSELAGGGSDLRCRGSYAACIGIGDTLLLSGVVNEFPLVVRGALVVDEDAFRFRCAGHTGDTRSDVQTLHACVLVRESTRSRRGQNLLDHVDRRIVARARLHSRLRIVGRISL